MSLACKTAYGIRDVKVLLSMGTRGEPTGPNYFSLLFRASANNACAARVRFDLRWGTGTRHALHSSHSLAQTHGCFSLRTLAHGPVGRRDRVIEVVSNSRAILHPVILALCHRQLLIL